MHFMDQGFEDRFNLANEIRQSGLMAGFDTVQAGMLNMAEMINQTGFTFGQAAVFTKFSVCCRTTWCSSIIRVCKCNGN